jgi:hypothetical protein
MFVFLVKLNCRAAEFNTQLATLVFSGSTIYGTLRTPALFPEITQGCCNNDCCAFKVLCSPPRKTKTVKIILWRIKTLYHAITRKTLTLQNILFIKSFYYYNGGQYI